MVHEGFAIVARCNVRTIATSRIGGDRTTTVTPANLLATNINLVMLDASGN